MPDSGEIVISGREVYSSSQGTAVPTERRGLSMIFQTYALWPHMTAFKNIAYPLTCERPRLKRHEIAERVHRILNLVGIAELADQYPNQMSGGQQQRVALARALVSGAELILFDEPMSNVDAKVRETLRLEMLSMQRELNFSAIYVTHDQTEAMQLADRIAVLGGGKISQLDAPRDVYERPVSRYVANFIGSTNEISGVVASVHPNGTVTVETDLGELTGRRGPGVAAAGEDIVALWRPERCSVTSHQPEHRNRIRAHLDASLFVGSHVEYVLTAGAHPCRAWSASIDQDTDQTDVWIGIQDDDLLVLPRSDSDRSTRPD